MKIFKYLKIKLYEILNDTRAEWKIIPEEKFTSEQKAAFDRLADFLACMVEKYSSTIDEIITDKKTA